MERNNSSLRRARSWHRALSVAVAAVAACATVASAAYGAPPNATWPTGGQNLDNSRYRSFAPLTTAGEKLFAFTPGGS